MPVIDTKLEATVSFKDTSLVGAYYIKNENKSILEKNEENFFNHKHFYLRLKNKSILDGEFSALS